MRLSPRIRLIQPHKPGPVGVVMFGSYKSSECWSNGLLGKTGDLSLGVFSPILQRSMTPILHVFCHHSSSPLLPRTTYEPASPPREMNQNPVVWARVLYYLTVNPSFVTGSERTRLPAAAEIALEMAPNAAGTAGSPAPVGAESLGTTTISISGDWLRRTIP